MFQKSKDKTFKGETFVVSIAGYLSGSIFAALLLLTE
jgi:hypothetical protein